jgi:hypothetical protein
MGFYPNMCPLPVGLEGAFAKDTKKIGGYIVPQSSFARALAGDTPARVAVAPRPARDRFGESLRSRLVRLEDRPRGKRSSFRQTRSGLCVTPKKGLSTSDIARHASVHGAAVRRRA